MGRPWLDHESWELVEEASEIAERDVGQLLLDADADELRDTRNAQLTTFVSSLMVLDAAERLGIEPSFCAGHSLGEYTALTATGALGFDDGVRLVIARADAMHDAGAENPGTMAAVLGLDDEQVDVACRRADADVWIANYNAPGQVVIAGSPDGVAAAADHAKELGAKKVMPLPVSGRLPHAVHDQRPRPAPRGHRRGRPARRRGARRVQRRCPPPPARRRSGRACSPPSCRRPCDGSTSCSSSPTTASTSSSSSARAACSPGWPSAPRRRRGPISVATPEDLDKLIEFVQQSMPARPERIEGEHLFASERLVVSPAAGHLHPRRRTSATARRSRSAPCSDTSVSHEVRSPFAGVLQSYIAVDTERVMPRQPIAWLRTS